MPTRNPIPEHLAPVYRWLTGHAPRAAVSVAEAWLADPELAERMLTSLVPTWRASVRAERQRRKVAAI